MSRPIITLTTDFGTGSPYIAQMKGVILQICPQANIIDLTHAIPPQDVQAGAIALRDATPFFPLGSIHVAVVDPGVGTARQIIYAEAAGQHFIGPDNGLLSLVAIDIHTLIAVTNTAWWRQTVSNTFHGRDIMAPVAAHLGMGVKPYQIGPRINAIQRITIDSAEALIGKVVGCIEHFDSFGNAITNISQQTVQSSRPSPDHGMRIGVHGLVLTEIAKTYSDCKGLVALFGSRGFLEFALVNGSAEETFDLRPGQRVTIEWQEKPFQCVGR